MNRISRSLVRPLSLLTILVLATCAPPDDSANSPAAPVQRAALGTFNVLTRQYNNARTGANLSEKVLNTSNVNSAQFGRLFQMSVDEAVYAGILYVSGLTINGGTHNVIYVATMNNSVYAFDADFGTQL